MNFILKKEGVDEQHHIHHIEGDDVVSEHFEWTVKMDDRILLIFGFDKNGVEKEEAKYLKRGFVRDESV